MLVADVYAAQGDNFQARGTLNSIIDNKFPVAEMVEAARQQPESPGADATTQRRGARAPAKATAAKPTKAAPRESHAGRAETGRGCRAPAAGRRRAAAWRRAASRAVNQPAAPPRPATQRHQVSSAAA
ncbi:MAG: hypothetical protein WKG07_11680 [Hymenobacter sp.]